MLTIWRTARVTVWLTVWLTVRLAAGTGIDRLVGASEIGRSRANRICVRAALIVGAIRFVAWRIVARRVCTRRPTAGRTAWKTKTPAKTRRAAMENPRNVVGVGARGEGRNRLLGRAGSGCRVIGRCVK